MAEIQNTNPEKQNQVVETKKISEEELKLKELKISIVKEKTMPLFWHIEWFERWMNYLLSPNVSKDKLNKILEFLNRVVDYNNEHDKKTFFLGLKKDWFFTDNNSLDDFLDNNASFISKVKNEVKITKKDVEVNQENVEVNQGKEKEKSKTEVYVKKVLEKFNKPEFKWEFDKELNALYECRNLWDSVEDKAKFREVVLTLLTKIKTKEASTGDKKYGELFASVSREFKSAWVITDWDIAKIISDSAKLSESTNKIETKLNPYEWFNKIGDDGKMFVKHNWDSKTNDIISFNEKWRVSEKIASSKSGYEVKIDNPMPLTRDITMLNTKIVEVESQISVIKEQFKKAELIKSKWNPTEEDKTFIKNFESSKSQLETTLNTLNERLSKMKDRLEKYEDEAKVKNNKVEEQEKNKTVLRNKIDVLDSLQLTSFFSQDNLDELLDYLQTDEIEKITWIKLDFSTNTKEITKTNLKTIMSKLFGKSKNEIFENGTDKLIPPYDKQEYIKQTELTREPKIINNWVFVKEWIRDRLSKHVK